MPQPTTVSHDGGCAERPRARVPRCAPTDLRHATRAVDHSKPRWQWRFRLAQASGGTDYNPGSASASRFTASSTETSPTLGVMESLSSAIVSPTSCNARACRVIERASKKPT